MTNIHLLKVDLLKLSQRIGRALRETPGEEISYHASVELLEDLEDEIGGLGHDLDAIRASGLTPLSRTKLHMRYLPARTRRTNREDTGAIMTIHLTAHGYERTITDLELVRAELIKAGFPPHRPTDEWICYWLKTDMSLAAIIRMACGQPNNPDTATAGTPPPR